MTTSRAAFFVIAFASAAVANPAAINVRLGDTVAQVDAVLGVAFKKSPPVYGTDLTRYYVQPGGRVQVSFRLGKLCSIGYLGRYSDHAAMALLETQAPADDWRLERTFHDKRGVLRQYRTVDGRFIAHISDRGVGLYTPDAFF